MKYSISQDLADFVQKHATESKVYFVCARSWLSDPALGDTVGN